MVGTRPFWLGRVGTFLPTSLLLWRVTSCERRKATPSSSLPLFFSSTGPAKARVIRSSNVRRTPSDQAKIVAHVKKGDIVTLVAPESHKDYIHVETAAGVKGWLLAQNIHDIDE